MIITILILAASLALLIWSANVFIDGASSVAKYYGMPPLLIGMIIVGFGTSAPEMSVSAIASIQGNPGIALGNAYGSNITNIALILGLGAMVNPIFVHSQVLRKELPILTVVTILAAFQLYNGYLSRIESIILLLVFGVIIAWSIWQGLNKRADSFGDEIKKELNSKTISIGYSLIKLLAGLVLLIISSRVLVWAAVKIANGLGVSDLVIGLTVVAVGTSLPELASTLIAARKGEHDIALGNVIGSNLFNTLAVVGIAGAIRPLTIEKDIFYRDMTVMSVLTISLFVIGWGFRGKGRINRIEGAVLFIAYLCYTAYLIMFN